MKLYYFPPSPNSIKVNAVLEHLRLDVERYAIDFTKREQRADWFLALNPNGCVPVLEEDGFVIWESNAIIQYLAERSDSALWPESRQRRAQVSQWLYWQSAHFGPAVGTLLFERLVKKVFKWGDENPLEIEKGLQGFAKFAPVLNAHLQSRVYLLGEVITIADFSLAAYLVHADACGLPLNNYSEIQNWYARIAEHGAWKKALALIKY